MSWAYTVGDIIWSVLNGRKMMVLEQIHTQGDLISEFGYKLRCSDYKEQFLYDFEVTALDPTSKPPKDTKQETVNNEE